MITRFFVLPIVLVASLLAGCMGTPAVIKEVADIPVENLRATKNSKPIQFKKIVVKLKRGEHIGAMQADLLCLPVGDLLWKGGRISIDSDEFTEAFKEELEKYEFKTVGDTNALFEDPSTWKSEILVAGLVTELKANICYPMTGFRNWSSSKGEAYLKVNWQIYSKLDRSVVHSATTEGAAKIEESVAGADSLVILNAFAQATRNLLADNEFRKIVSRGGETIKETAYKSGDSIVISANVSKPLGDSPEEWVNGVVTVFAGSGHGSGFVISDNLLLTNYHVVREADSVVIKFNNGMQVVGKTMAYNSGIDVAIVKVDATLPKHFRLSKTMPVVGTDVYAIGTPLEEQLQSTVTRGIVSGIREEDNKKLIQSDVNIRPGNSGGPLVDKSGSAVGIAVSGLVINNVQQDINFFIPIGDALKSLGVVY
jgi:S1-C subfamily serine protease